MRKELKFRKIACLKDKPLITFHRGTIGWNLSQNLTGWAGVWFPAPKSDDPQLPVTPVARDPTPFPELGRSSPLHHHTHMQK